jgi:hypothetical protein
MMISTRPGKATWKAHPAATDSGRARIQGERPGCRGGQLLLMGDQRFSIIGPHTNIFNYRRSATAPAFDMR